MGLKKRLSHSESPLKSKNTCQSLELRETQALTRSRPGLGSVLCQFLGFGWTGCWTTVGRLGPGLGVSERKPFAAIKDDQVPHEGERGQETEGRGALLQGCPAVVCGEDEGGDDEEQSDGRRVTEVQFSPAGDANSLVQWCGQQDEQKKSEEEGRAAHKLKEVQRDATDAAVYHLLLHEGHERQEHFKELDEEPGQVQDLGWDTETGRLWIWSRGRRIYTLRRHQSSGSVSVRSEINGAHFL